MTIAAAAALVALAASSTDFALIVTNNRSSNAARPDLHYADDDGVQYARLFRELLGSDHVVLLTTPDSETTALRPDLAKDVAPPTRENLDAAVAELAPKLKGAGLYLVFAGHGDLDQGQGYLDLENGRLTARELEERVIAKLPAERIHLILDSCNSYFLLNPRKPGGKRWAAPAEPQAGLLARHPNVGAIISTSAEAVTYEWSEVQSGIFSYEVRSGLRGGADADGDGKVTYAELAGFITVANRALVNDLYRPKVFFQGPGSDAKAVFASYPEAYGHVLRVGSEGARRLTVRDRQGVRLLDVNKEAGVALTLWLPSEPGAGVFESKRTSGRVTVQYRSLGATGEEHLDALVSAEPSLAARGESPVFEALFEQPFGPAAFTDVETARVKAPPAEPTAVTQADAARLRLYVRHGATLGRQLRTSNGVTTLGMALVAGALAAGIQLSDSTQVRVETLTLAGFSLGSLVSAIVLMATTSLEEKLDREADQLDFSTEATRSASLLKLEGRLREVRDGEHAARITGGILNLVAGSLVGASGGVQLGVTAQRHRTIDTGGLVTVVAGVAVLVNGLYALVWSRATTESVFEAYESDPAVVQRLGNASGEGITVGLELGPLPGGAFAGLRGTF